jgi:hypothetical protein
VVFEVRQTDRWATDPEARQVRCFAVTQKVTVGTLEALGAKQLPIAGATTAPAGQSQPATTVVPTSSTRVAPVPPTARPGSPPTSSVNVGGPVSCTRRRRRTADGALRTRRRRAPASGPRRNA